MSRDVGLTNRKIVILLGQFARAGSERQAFLLARELRRTHGLKAEVWALRTDGQDADYALEFEAVGIPTRILGCRYPMRSPVRVMRGLQWVNGLRLVARHLRKARVDILLPFTAWPNVIAGLTYRLAGVPLCIWGERNAGSMRIPTPERVAVKQYRHFIANSTAGIEFLAQEMRIGRERISFVPNGVEEPKIDRRVDWRGVLRLKPTELLVAKVADVTELMDHATLLRAWKLVQDNWTVGDRPFLVLAGTRNYDDTVLECRRIVQETGLDDTVRFLDSVPGIPTLIHTCDLSVFSSRIKGMPNAVLESMAAGKAVIATDLPGVRDALGPNAGEELVPPGDAGKLASALSSLLRNKERRDALGRVNQSRALGEFSVGSMTQRYLRIMQENLPRVEADSMGEFALIHEVRDAVKSSSGMGQ